MIEVSAHRCPKPHIGSQKGSMSASDSNLCHGLNEGNCEVNEVNREVNEVNHEGNKGNREENLGRIITAISL